MSTDVKAAWPGSDESEVSRRRGRAGLLRVPRRPQRLLPRCGPRRMRVYRRRRWKGLWGSAFRTADEPIVVA